ncbi:50S ribosomal protein L18 [Tindallia californiensis]|uniref:Large ribosomal subunit protein uL18 n=1 Tax=Tindallia californiensis TaxID=159292 RepID=A0A1H3QXP2_9FIRM|nr:50S ribosomal protein L18 [Tindallia californiensis]SDZ18197.1 large subunit ribosomal protein L18 [Tindallia californiensis]
MLKKPSKNSLRLKRHKRLRNKVSGTPQRPRLNVYRSLNNIYAQVIDDINGKTLVAASSLEKEVKDQVKSCASKEASALVGKIVAQRAVEQGITEVTFDRGGYIYHGRVKSLADSAREAGLKF